MPSLIDESRLLNDEPIHDDALIARLKEIARETRISIIHTIAAPRMGHIGGDFSVTDVLVTLFFAVMRYRAGEPDWAGRQRFTRCWPKLVISAQNSCQPSWHRCLC